MKNIKKVIIAVAAIGVLGAAGTAFAAASQSPVQILADLTGRTIQEVYDERAYGKTLAFIADEEGKLEDFQKEMLELKKEVLDQRVKDGVITQEEADKIYENIKYNLANYDLNGYGCAGIQGGKGGGIGFGRGCGNGRGLGLGQGNGARFRRGN